MDWNWHPLQKRECECECEWWGGGRRNTAVRAFRCLRSHCAIRSEVFQSSWLYLDVINAKARNGGFQSSQVKSIVLLEGTKESKWRGRTQARQCFYFFFVPNFRKGVSIVGVFCLCFVCGRRVNGMEGMIIYGHKTERTQKHATEKHQNNQSYGLEHAVPPNRPHQSCKGVRKFTFRAQIDKKIELRKKEIGVAHVSRMSTVLHERLR